MKKVGYKNFKRIISNIENLTIVLFKINTRDTRAKKEIRKSYQVNGEIDVVKPSPRSTTTTQAKNANATNKKDAANKNEIRLTQDQLMALLSAIKSGDKNPGGSSNLLENLNINLSDSEGDRAQASKPNQQGSHHGKMPDGNNNINHQDGASNEERIKRMLIEKKKQKWASEKGLIFSNIIMFFLKRRNANLQN